MRSMSVVKLPLSLFVSLFQVCPLSAKPCFVRNWSTSMMQIRAFVFCCTCLSYESLSLDYIHCLFLSITAMKVTACSTHWRWPWDRECQFSAPREVPVAFFQSQKGVEINSLLKQLLLNRKQGAQNTPSTAAEYRIHWNSWAHFGWNLLFWAFIG